MRRPGPRPRRWNVLAGCRQGRRAVRPYDRRSLVTEAKFHLLGDRALDVALLDRFNVALTCRITRRAWSVKLGITRQRCSAAEKARTFRGIAHRHRPALAVKCIQQAVSSPTFKHSREL